MGMEAWEREDGGAGGGGGKEGGCGAGVMGGDDGALVTTYVHTDGGAAGGGAGGAQNGWTPLYAACQEGNGEAVKLLLADERVDVNQADKVRVGGEGEGGWGEGGGRGAECSARQGAGRQELTAAGRRV